MRRILWLLRDATAKVLVFSTWVDVIDLMAHALGANGVRFAYPRSQAKFSRELAAFRSSAAPAQQGEERSANGAARFVRASVS